MRITDSIAPPCIRLHSIYRPCFTACSRRTYSDVAIAWKPSSPVNMSISEIAIRCGCPSCSPRFSSTIPLNACNTGSIAGRPASGPVCPNPEIE